MKIPYKVRLTWIYSLSSSDFDIIFHHSILSFLSYSVYSYWEKERPKNRKICERFAIIILPCVRFILTVIIIILCVFFSIIRNSQWYFIIVKSAYLWHGAYSGVIVHLLNLQFYMVFSLISSNKMKNIVNIFVHLVYGFFLLLLFLFLLIFRSILLSWLCFSSLLRLGIVY